MTCKDIYEHALRLLGECVDTGANDDYEERAPYLLYGFCSEALSVNAAIRRARGLKEELRLEQPVIPLARTFPLHSMFATPAAFYLAAMLVLEEYPETSDRLYDKYSDAMSRISAALPSICEKIKNRYFFD